MLSLKTIHSRWLRVTVKVRVEVRVRVRVIE